MAITKLMYMNQSKGCPHDHLRNAIDYILDVKHDGAKTAGGTLVGGNSGIDHKEILENFLETKRAYGKMDGRQGYHFVISFAPGETDTATAYDVIREFCEQYLGDNYDYVFAIHNDKEHVHGHIIFNSVSRMTGYKYHYKKGDWEKYIQPITDQVCIEHGLEPLKFEKGALRQSYASWAVKKGGRIDWTRIICADVDYAIQVSSNMKEFYENMEKMNYTIRKGYSQKEKKSMFTYIFTTPEGKVYKRRSIHRLIPIGYGPDEIEERIRTKTGSKSYEQVVEQLSNRASEYLKPTVLKNTRTYKRLYQAVSYYKLPNPFAVPAYRVRNDMVNLNKLLEECKYLKENPVKREGELKERTVRLEEKITAMLEQRRKLYAIYNNASQEERAAMDEYESLQRQIIVAEEKHDDIFEKIEEKMQELEKRFPAEMLEVAGRIQKLGSDIYAARREKRILIRIVQADMQLEQKLQEHQIRK